MLICKDCGNYAGIVIQAQCKEIIILYSCFATFFVNTKPANKVFKNFIGTDQYTLMEQAIDYANWQVVFKLKVLKYFEMHVVREIGLFLDSGNSNLMNLYCTLRGRIKGTKCALFSIKCKGVVWKKEQL